MGPTIYITIETDEFFEKFELDGVTNEAIVALIRRCGKALSAQLKAQDKAE